MAKIDQTRISRSEVHQLVKEICPDFGDTLPPGNPEHTDSVITMQSHILEMLHQGIGVRRYLKWADKKRELNFPEDRINYPWLFTHRLPGRLTLQRHLTSYKKDGKRGLYPKLHLRGRSYKMANLQAAYVICRVASSPEISITQLERELIASEPRMQAPRVSYSTIYRFVRALPVALKSGLEDPAKIQWEQETCYLPNNRHDPMDLWQMDYSPAGYRVGRADSDHGTPAHRLVVRCAVPDGIIMASTWCLGQPKSADLVAVLKAAMMSKKGQYGTYGGIPRRIQVDHGGVNLSDDFKRICAALDIQLIYSPKQCPSANGSVEAVFADYTKGFQTGLNQMVSTNDSFRLSTKGHLTPEQSTELQERYLLQFNHMPPKGRLSRYEKHMRAVKNLGVELIDDARVNRHLVYSHPVTKRRDGYVFDGVHYDSRPLSDIPKRTGIILLRPPDYAPEKIEVVTKRYEHLCWVPQSIPNNALAENILPEKRSILKQVKGLAACVKGLSECFSETGLNLGPKPIIPKKRRKKVRSKAIIDPVTGRDPEPRSLANATQRAVKETVSVTEMMAKLDSTIGGRL